MSSIVEEPKHNQPEYSISDISQALKGVVERSFSYVRVRGEISGFKRAASGHCYLDLKDENAVLKAAQQAIHLSAWVIGEDSGLCVDALNGSPGIHSARFASMESNTNASDEANNQRLLAELHDVPLEKRTAHYVSHIAFSDPSGNIRCQCESKCSGRIRLQAAGSGGFGYDPLFEIVELHKTFGELGPHFKSMISHRARAFRKFVRQLRAIKCD